MRMYRVTVGVEGGETRVLKVPSKTDVQAGDAAVTRMAPAESILSIEETDDPYHEVDALPAGTHTQPDQIV